MRRVFMLMVGLLLPALASAQQPDTTRIVDARINRYCHPPDECVLRGALIWDSTNVVPFYPHIMRSVGIDGEAKVTFSVLPNGSVDRESVVISGSSNRAFHQPILDAVHSWRFRVETSDQPRAISTGIDIIFAFVDNCPEGLDRPMSALRTSSGSTQLMSLVCRERLVIRH